MRILFCSECFPTAADRLSTILPNDEVLRCSIDDVPIHLDGVDVLVPAMAGVGEHEYAPGGGSLGRSNVGAIRRAQVQRHQTGVAKQTDQRSRFSWGEVSKLNRVPYWPDAARNPSEPSVTDATDAFLSASRPYGTLWRGIYSL